VAGWQRDQTGGWAVYARTDQLIAGLERAVDPNLDGDAHDAARIALVGAAVSYGAFADSPEARAINGALQLDTLVVAPVGNDGPAGPGYGSVSSPGGAPAALTAGAADLRVNAEEVPVAVRIGLELVLDRRVPLAGAVVSAHPRELELAAPRHGTGPTIDRFFDERGHSLVAGRAALIHGGGDPVAAIEDAAQAGATAVVVYGTQLPAGGISVDESVEVPVVSVPLRVAQAASGRYREGRASDDLDRRAVRRAQRRRRRDRALLVRAALAFDGRVKPDVAAPGVALVTSEPGANEDGTPRFGTVNGSSPAAAVVAGAAAVLAQARPGLRALDLRACSRDGALDPRHERHRAGRRPGRPRCGHGGEVSVDPVTLAFAGRQGDGWHSSPGGRRAQLLDAAACSCESASRGAAAS
jgi:hypothetical protein